MARPTIDPERLRALLDGINSHGPMPETGGFARPAFSAADMAVRDWFASVLERDGLAVRRDPVGNVFGRYGPSDGPAILVGSHLDTVPQGGALDGALGVAAALESLRALRDAGLAPARAIEIVATADEEGRFGGMLGSQAMAGILTDEWVAQARDEHGVRLTDAMARVGLDPAMATTAARSTDSVAAFLELHIEQGPVLEAAGVRVGLAHAVSGCCVWDVGLRGRADHSGTTPMTARADAFAGLAHAAAQIPEIIATAGGEGSRITIGSVMLSPNAVHTIPGAAHASVVLRDPEEAVMQALAQRLRAVLADAARRRGLTLTIDQRSWLPPVQLDKRLAARIERLAARSGQALRSIVSGAGHDAQTMQSLCPSALIFVPSRHGLSHCPEEHTDWADILPGVQLLADLVADLALDAG